ncbi:MAG: hypothetical protein HYY04_18510 [Chloroflexi bacterium]|nr:hypothetical protein [Chloroflexota bacterium]
MSPAKCLVVLIVVAVLGFLFIFNRRKMNQLTIGIIVTYIVLAAYRLSQQQNDEETLWSMAIFFGGGLLLWGGLWIAHRYSVRKSHRANSSPPNSSRRK